MLYDFNEAWTKISDIPYDVCVCGTGPAGITTARKLASHGKKVLLLEGGDLSYTDASQEIYNGTSVGRRYWHVENGRLRFFGGTSNHWTGRCGIFDQIDFEERDYFGLPGWPISRQQVLAHLDEAQEILDISGSNLSPVPMPEFQSGAFEENGFALSPPTRFAEKYESELKQSPLIDVFYNANVTNVKLTENRSGVDSLMVESYNGHKVAVSAKAYVLALGAIETARILLNSDGQVQGGVGNRHGMVGRCFMEHLNVSIGRFIVTDTSFWRKDRALVPTAEFMRQNNLGNGILSFDSSGAPQSYGRLRVLKQFLRETGCALPSMKSVARKVIDFDCPGDGLVTSLIEQLPNPASRVSLIRDTDKFGLRRVQLDWKLHEGDLRTIRALSVKAAQEMARLDKARVQLAPFITNRELAIEVGAHAHQMGTARMASNPKFGVVNEQCQVHDVANLYLMGSSVFPTGGGTNPTLTIVMLSLNLANILNERI